MASLVLFDSNHKDLLPLTFTRPVAEIRIGILTLTQKWELLLSRKASFYTEDYLQEKYPMAISDDNLLVNGGVIPERDLAIQVGKLGYGEALSWEGKLIAARVGYNEATKILLGDLSGIRVRNLDVEPLQVLRPFDVFRLNGQALQLDFEELTRGRKSASLSSTNRVIAPENVFVEEGAYVECAIINASAGSVYIGKHSEIMEGAIVRGPFALCEHSSLKMGAKIYGPTTIGPYSKVGGEINNSVVFGYSNKAHESIVLRGLDLFDHIIIAIGYNSTKRSLYPLDTRLRMINKVFEGNSRVSVKSYQGLTVDLCKSIHVHFIIRGLRTAADFEFERAIAQVNRMMDKEMESVFLLTSPELTPVNSTIVRDILVHVVRYSIGQR